MTATRVLYQRESIFLILWSFNTFGCRHRWGSKGVAYQLYNARCSAPLAFKHKAAILDSFRRLGVSTQSLLAVDGQPLSPLMSPIRNPDHWYWEYHHQDRGFIKNKGSVEPRLVQRHSNSILNECFLWRQREQCVKTVKVMQHEQDCDQNGRVNLCLQEG